MAETLIKLDNIVKSYGSNTVVKGMSLEVKDGEFLTFLGPSGCGKTTMLRMISGFETPDSGTIQLNGRDLISIPPNKREINTVFQNYALFPHLTVRDNIGFGLKMKKVSPSEIKERVDEMLAITHLESLANRKPSQLSGGQQQRVAIARGLVNKPKVVLLDEPLGALDLQLRKQMQLDLKRLQKKLGTTYIYVTHDQEEALTMSDRIVLMYNGQIEQIGTPREIYSNPKTEFVANFLGESNILEGVYNCENDNAFFEIEGEKLPVKVFEGNPTLISVRPEDIKLSYKKESPFALEAVVSDCIFMGIVYSMRVTLKSGKVLKIVSTENKFKVGDSVFANFNMEKISCIL